MIKCGACFLASLWCDGFYMVDYFDVLKYALPHKSVGVQSYVISSGVILWSSFTCVEECLFVNVYRNSSLF